MTEYKITTLTKEQMEQQIELYQQLLEPTTKIHELAKQLFDISGGVYNWRNTDMRLWKIICEKFEPSQLLNNYGDIFVIVESFDFFPNIYHKAKRLLWNLTLSKESYKVEEQVLTDTEGEYDWTDYNVSLWEEIEK